MIAELEAEADKNGRTRSEHIRNTLAIRHEHGEEVVEYEKRIAELERENDRTRRQLAATNKRVEEHRKLVRYTETERAYRGAGLRTRVKW